MNQPAVHHVSKAGFTKMTNYYGMSGKTPRCPACGAETWFRSGTKGNNSAFVCHICNAETRGA